jgi:hypothetical protein
MRRKRRDEDELRPSLEEALATLQRTGRPVPLRRDGAVVAALVSLEDLRDQLGSPELTVSRRPPLRPAASPTRTLEALRELRDLATESD